MSWIMARADTSNLITMDKKYQTRGNGKNIPSCPVRILCVDCKSGEADYPVVGLALQPDGTEEIRHWGADGSFQTARPYPEDLIPVPTKHEAWFVTCHVQAMAQFATKEEAERFIRNDAGIRDSAKVAKVIWED